MGRNAANNVEHNTKRSKCFMFQVVDNNGVLNKCDRFFESSTVDSFLVISSSSPFQKMRLIYGLL
eukprot:scaffold34697_cov191-Amphora_coffeaeformis.AAC.1